MSKPASADLRLGRWQDVLSDVTCDALLTDAPYSAKTHGGHDAAAEDAKYRELISYEPWGEQEISNFVAHWSPRTRGWFITITDHVLVPIWTRLLNEAGRYTFAPLPLVETGSRVRLQGDGPSSWTCHVVVSRPRHEPYSKWGATPGAYVAPNERKPVIGGKPLRLMRAIVRDYTRPGDIVCDPCAGGGTTLLAALTEGRGAVGAEMDPAHYEIARKRLAAGYTPPLFFDDDAA